MTGYTSRPDGEVRYIHVDTIRVNHKKLRKLSNAKIGQYVRDYENGDCFPPISVSECGEFFTIRDGRHRYQAQLSAGFTVIAVTL